MKPTYNNLRINYPDRELYPRGLLLEMLGWDDLLKNGNYADTCAMRMSYALARSGVWLAGARMKGKGKYVAGRPIEPGQAKLSRILVRMWGEPERYKNDDKARKATEGRTGVVSFFHINPDSPVGQGHIDLLEPSGTGWMQCRMDCYWRSREVWFWPLK